MIMGLIGLLLPILGIIGYANQIWWLFYIAGGIAAVLDVLSLLTGELRCAGSFITIVFWIAGYLLTDSVWDGIILGSCASSILMIVGTFIFVAFTAGIGAALTGFTNLIEWVRNLRHNK